MGIEFNLQFFADEEVTAEPQTSTETVPTGDVETATEKGKTEPTQGTE